MGRIELRTVQAGTAEFTRRFAKMTQNVSMLSFPCFIGVAAIVPEVFRIWLDNRWAAGIVPTQLLLLSGPPLAVFYSIDAALLANNLSSVFRKMALWQGLTLSATVLCAAPFGLNMTCLALAVRSWIVMPAFLIVFGRSCQIPVSTVLLSPLRSLIGAICMAAFVSLPFFHLAWAYRGIDIVVMVSAGILFYIAYLYCFARRQFMEFLADFLHKHSPEPRVTL